MPCPPSWIGERTRSVPMRTGMSMNLPSASTALHVLLGLFIVALSSAGFSQSFDTGDDPWHVVQPPYYRYNDGNVTLNTGLGRCCVGQCDGSTSCWNVVIGPGAERSQEQYCRQQQYNTYQMCRSSAGNPGQQNGLSPNSPLIPHYQYVCVVFDPSTYNPRMPRGYSGRHACVMSPGSSNRPGAPCHCPGYAATGETQWVRR